MRSAEDGRRRPAGKEKDKRDCAGKERRQRDESGRLEKRKRDASGSVERRLNARREKQPDPRATGPSTTTSICTVKAMSDCTTTGGAILHSLPSKGKWRTRTTVLSRWGQVLTLPPSRTSPISSSTNILTTL